MNKMVWICLLMRCSTAQVHGMNTPIPKTPNAPGTWVTLSTDVQILTAVYVAFARNWNTLYQELSAPKVAYIKQLVENPSLRPFVKAPVTKRVRTYLKEQCPECTDLDMQLFLNAAIHWKNKDTKKGGLVLVSPLKNKLKLVVHTRRNQNF